MSKVHFGARVRVKVTLTVNGNHPIYQDILKEDSELQHKMTRNLSDLALLSQGMLKGSDLTNFISRSVEMMSKKKAEVEIE